MDGGGRAMQEQLPRATQDAYMDIGGRATQEQLPSGALAFICVMAFYNSDWQECQRIQQEYGGERGSRTLDPAFDQIPP